MLFQRKNKKAAQPQTDPQEVAQPPATEEMAREAFAHAQENAHRSEAHLRGLVLDKGMTLGQLQEKLSEGKTKQEIEDLIENLRFMSSTVEYDENILLRKSTSLLLQTLRTRDIPGGLLGFVPISDARVGADGCSLEILCPMATPQGTFEDQWHRIPTGDVDRIYVETTSEGPADEDAYMEIYVGRNCFKSPSESEGFGHLREALGKLFEIRWDVFVKAMQCLDDNDFLIYEKQEKG